MLGWDGGGAGHESDNQGCCEGVPAPGRALDFSTRGGTEVVAAAGQGAFEVDEHVNADQDEPDDRGGAVDATGDL
jgi:hypothetical protein